MIRNQIKLKKNDKFPVLPWSEENIEIPKKESRKIDFSQCHLFSSQFEELHNEFSIENRHKKNLTLFKTKLASIDSEETLKMRHDTCHRESVSHPPVKDIFKIMFDNEIISKKKLPELSHSINLSKLSEISNVPISEPRFDSMRTRTVISRFRRVKKDLEPLVSTGVIDNIKKI